MKQNYFIEQGTDPQKDIQFLEDEIYEFNSAKINKHDGSLFTRIVRDENKNIVGGIAGWTWASSCEITQLWLDESIRKNGIGTLLLDAAEMEAKSKGCVTILVKTYSFQAPHFYEKHGFAIQCVINDFPEGYNYCILAKRIGRTG